MKKSETHSALLLLIPFTVLINSISAQVGFNNPNPDPSSLVDLTAYDKGLLLPRMSSLQRIAIANPANGLMVFDADLNAFCEYDTISNPDKWVMINPWKADAQANANVLLATTGNVGIGVPNPIQKLEVAGNITATNSVTANSATFTGTVTANNFTGDGVVPARAIIIWYGITPPAGWKICDGTNGTPDLRGRFVIGSGTNGSPAFGDINPAYTVGSWGGKNKHVLAKTEIPKHTHTSNGDGATINITNSGAHTHSVPLIAGSVPVNCGGACQVVPTNGGASTISGGNHTHPNSSFTGTVGDGTADGLNSQSHENRPPYYVLMYIMKQ